MSSWLPLYLSDLSFYYLHLQCQAGSQSFKWSLRFCLESRRIVDEAGFGEDTSGDQAATRSLSGIQVPSKIGRSACSRDSAPSLHRAKGGYLSLLRSE